MTDFVNDVSKFPKLSCDEIFFEIRSYFCKTAGNSTDTAVYLLRSADAPLS